MLLHSLRLRLSFQECLLCHNHSAFTGSATKFPIAFKSVIVGMMGADGVADYISNPHANFTYVIHQNP